LLDAAAADADVAEIESERHRYTSPAPPLLLRRPMPLPLTPRCRDAALSATRHAEDAMPLDFRASDTLDTLF